MMHLDNKYLIISNDFTIHSNAVLKKIFSPAHQYRTSSHILLRVFKHKSMQFPGNINEVSLITFR